MPTGYTANIAKGITFQQFALDCSRAFGALVMMRDDPMDAKIPDLIIPSDYHLKNLKKARRMKAQLLKMNVKSLLRKADKKAKEEFIKKVNELSRYRLERRELRRKYEAMLQQAELYVPPSPEHVAYRDFMISQIKESIDFDCSEKYLDQIPVKQKNIGEWIDEHLASLDKDISYHGEHWKKDKKNAEGRTRWIRQLKRSLKIPITNIKRKF